MNDKMNELNKTKTHDYSIGFQPLINARIKEKIKRQEPNEEYFRQQLNPEWGELKVEKDYQLKKSGSLFIEEKQNKVDSGRKTTQAASWTHTWETEDGELLPIAVTYSTWYLDELIEKGNFPLVPAFNEDTKQPTEGRLVNFLETLRPILELIPTQILVDWVGELHSKKRQEFNDQRMEEERMKRLKELSKNRKA